ncbi:DUF4326 domain-containing protein [Pseudoxanthomonas japonensis]|nr:DUF4326 domain-containing protein [Pseudoxanthomonas japonensis]
MTVERIQLRRAKGWRMPADTVKVDRTTKGGNPFIVGKHGTQAECVRLFELTVGGYIALGTDNFDEQVAVRDYVVANREQLRGKNLACWCRIGTPCHADLLIQIANKETP